MRPRRSEGLETPNFFGLEFFKKLIAVTVVFGFRSEVFGFRFGLSFRIFGFLCGSGELRRLHQLWRLRQLRSSFFFFVDFLVPSAHLVVEINFCFAYLRRASQSAMRISLSLRFGLLLVSSYYAV